MKPVKSIEELREMAWAFRASRVLMLAHRLDIFTLLSRGGLSAGEIAHRQGSDPDMTERLLIACTALGLLEKKGDVYVNSELASTYLVRGGQLYQGGWIDHADLDLWPYWGSELDRELGGYRTEDEGWTRRFIKAMHSLAIGGEAEGLAEALDLRGRRLLYDIGGGPGTFSIYLCRANRDLRAVVFDLPEVVAITREVIREYGMEGQVSTREGTWDTDDFGEEDADVVLLSNVLHGPGSKAEMKLEKAYRSLKPGGLLIVRDFMLDDDKTGPVAPALFNLMLGAYTKAEMKALIESAGFTGVREIETASKSHTVIAADRPQDR